MHLAIVIAALGLLAQPAPAATLRDLADCGVFEHVDATIAACTRVLEEEATPDAERGVALYNRGTAYEAKGAYDAALADYTAVLKIKQIGLVYANRGLVYQRLRDYQRSIADLDEALRLSPDLEQAYKWRGVDYFNIGEYRRALADFDAALRIDPGDKEVY